jgi:hypothetical protein
MAPHAEHNAFVDPLHGLYLGPVHPIHNFKQRDLPSSPSAYVPRTRCGVKCRAADPGPATTPSLRRSRVCSAALRLSRSASKTRVNALVPHCARETATEHFRSDDDAKKRSRGAFLLPHPEVRALASLEG